MATAFPPNPPAGTIVHGPNGASWKYDGVKWVSGVTGPWVSEGGDTMTGPLFLPGNPTLPMQAATMDFVIHEEEIHVGEANFDGQVYGRELGEWTPVLPITGGLMQGSIDMDNWWTINGLPTPLLHDQAVNKAYVDQTITALQPFMGTWLPATNFPDLSNTANNINGSYWIASTVDPNVSETAPANIPGLGGAQIHNGSMIVWNGSARQYQQVQSAQLTKPQADTYYVALAGSTMTGPLILNADPAQPLGAATKEYVDAAFHSMPVSIPMVYIGDSPPATSQVGDLWWSSTNTQLYVYYDDGTSRQWVAASNAPNPAAGTGTGITEAPTDGKIYGRNGQLAIWSPVLSSAGGTMTGPIILAADPASPMQPATKQYVDNHVGTAAVSDTAPAAPVSGELWFNSTDLHLYVSYNDGTSTQWVVV